MLEKDTFFSHRKLGGIKTRLLKSKAVTLIELLAVIVILGVVALIVTPIIIGVINKKRKPLKLVFVEL